MKLPLWHQNEVAKPIHPQAFLQQSRFEGRLYRQLADIADGAANLIYTRWPRHWRRASGYNLDRLALPFLTPEKRKQFYSESNFHPRIATPTPDDHLNLAQLITGSEGTLGVTTEATLNLVPRPRQTALAVLHFDSLLDACAAIPNILACGPSASELLDEQLIQLVRSLPLWDEKTDFIMGTPSAVLLTEFYGESERELRNKIEHMQRHLRKKGWRIPIVPIIAPEEQREVWAVRKAGFNLLMSRRSRFKPAPGIEDVSVPPERLADYMEKILKICGEKEDIPGVVAYAHASAGCLHVRPLLDLHTQRGIELMAELTQRACDLAVEYGGVLSGEHGDGLTRSAFNERLFGPDLYRVMQAVKKIFDPANRLNPGKVVDGASPTEDLRYKPDYAPIELTTVFDWSTDGDLVAAVETCNGAAVCRKLGSGTMCPSFMATRDESDTTRGRANALRAAMTGHVSEKQLYSAEMYDIMDLCLGH